MALRDFHPAVREWFEAAFAAPTPCQLQAWPAIRAEHHTLIAAPTGSGKTLAAFLAAIDELVRLGVAGALRDETRVLYVSPLKALSNDIQKNLEAPLSGILARLEARGLESAAIRTMVRTGDTTSAERAAMRRAPPHILVTTPESLYILLSSDSGREMLRHVRSVIVDEIHAIAGTKRGSHLSLSLERLEALAGRRFTRIGLSATQRPIATVADFLLGSQASGDECEIVDSGHVRDRDLALELPETPLEAVMSGEAWAEVYDRLAQLIRAHRTTLVFVNTRRLAERVARHLSERLGEENVTSHHGSLSREQRLAAEQRLKHGALRALVATASLELGIDIGEVDLVCQLGSTRSIATFLQRVGRSGHAVNGTPKGRLFPLSRDELVECAALLDAARRGELDRLFVPQRPLDVLAQQIVAMVACEEWEEERLFSVVRRAYPYRDLPREAFDQVVRMLAEGYSTRRGRRSAYLHRDAVNARLRARRGARLTAVTSGGAIPDNADYDVVLEPTGTVIGTLNEDFAIESLPGDIFQLGNASWRILRIEAGKVRVADAEGLPPTIPFWLGEAPGRTDELSEAVSRLRAELDESLGAQDAETPADARRRAACELEARLGLCASAAEQLVDYLAAARGALGALPTRSHVILERFFDETGGMQLVVHSTHGSRLNRAWGLALRKRFCRKFNFELQAAATEDAIVLSLGESHSFALDEVARYLASRSVREVLTQALLAAPMFTVRWRWNAGISLAVPRFQGGKKVPPQLQRILAEDLVAAVFPDQLACVENLAGEREIPDHPLVEQTVRDGLTDAMDVDGVEALLARIERGEVLVTGRDLTEPSPLAQEILNAKPYAFLDDAPLEERRTQAVMSRRWLDPDSAADLGKLDEQAIARVAEEAWPTAHSPDELHDALLVLGFMTEAEAARHPRGGTFLGALGEERRASRLRARGADPLWVAAERLPEIELAFPGAELTPRIVAPPGLARPDLTREQALVELLRGRLSGLGPVCAASLERSAPWTARDVEGALLALEAEGFVLRGRFTPGAEHTEWCERRLLARIHRYTVNRLRQEIEPVSSADFMRFLLSWQHVAPGARLEGPSAIAAVIEQLEGFELPAAAWEGDVLPSRVSDYDPAALDSLCLSGRFVWARLGAGAAERRAGPIRTTPIALLDRRHRQHWFSLMPRADWRASLSANATRVGRFLEERGASFFDETVEGTGLLRTQVEEALAELVAAGVASADSFAGLRALLIPSHKRGSGRRRRRSIAATVADAGRWGILAAGRGPPDDSPVVAGSRLPIALVESVARALLKRYGVVFKRLLAKESAIPLWRELLGVFRRLEARGEIRGGRFVAGFAGEQFALPEALAALRGVRRTPPSGELVALGGADPLNLVGIVTPGERVSSLLANRVLYRDGVPIAVHAGREVTFLEAVDPAVEWDTRNALLRKRIPPELRAYLQ